MEHRRLATSNNTTWYYTTEDRITALNTATQKPWLRPWPLALEKSGQSQRPWKAKQLAWPPGQAGRALGTGNELLDLNNERITSNDTSVQQSKCFPKQLMVHNTMDNIKCVVQLISM